MDEIGAIIGQIHDAQSTIASAVEEQTATTNEMGRNVAEAATGSAEIAHNIGEIAGKAEQSTSTVEAMGGALDELESMSSALRSRI